MVRERSEYLFSNSSPHPAEIRVRAVIVCPVRGDDRREDPVVSLWKRREPLAQEALPAGVGGLEHQQTIYAGPDPDAIPVTLNGRYALSGCSDKRMFVLPAVHRYPVPQVLGEAYSDALDGRPGLEKVLDELLAELLYVSSEMILRQCVDRVAHGVSR